MRRHSLMLLAGAVTLLAVGCTSGDETASKDASPSPSAEAVKSPTATQSFDNPVVSEKGKDGKLGGDKDGKDAKKKLAKNKVAGLLQSTDPDERAKRVQAGIPKRGGLDPFASLPPILTFRAPEPVAGGSGGGGAGRGNGPGGTTFGPGGSPLAGSGGSGGRPGGGGSPGTSVANVPSIPSFPAGGEIRLPRPSIAARPKPTAVAARPMNVGNPNAGGTAGAGENPGLKPLPPIPEPTLAKSVEVTGVVTIAGETQAIVKAPNEPTSRHVAVGQRLANGQVLVKRIEVNAGTDPIVVFEQNGIEVARAVGEKAAPGVAGVPTAFVPTPPAL
jgi:hypothetical protein